MPHGDLKNVNLSYSPSLCAQAQEVVRDMLHQLKEHLTLSMVPAINVRDWLKVYPRKEQLQGLLPLVDQWANLVGCCGAWLGALSC